MAVSRTKLTPDVARRICDALAAGNTREDAAAFAGISPRTLQQWLRMGRRELRGRHHQLAADVHKAEAGCAVRNLAVIQKAAGTEHFVERRVRTDADGRVTTEEITAGPDWRAAAWWVERRRIEFSRDWPEVRELREELRRLAALLHESRLSPAAFAALGRDPVDGALPPPLPNGDGAAPGPGLEPLGD